jgi:hypothetical protein
VPVTRKSSNPPVPDAFAPDSLAIDSALTALELTRRAYAVDRFLPRK